MEDVVLNGVELDVLYNSVAGLAVYAKLDSKDVGGIDELAHVISLDGEVGGDEALVVADFHNLLTGLESAGEGEVDNIAAVEHNGDEVGLAQLLGCLLAEVSTGLGCQLKCLHSSVGVLIGCVTQN